MSVCVLVRAPVVPTLLMFISHIIIFHSVNPAWQIVFLFAENCYQVLHLTPRSSVTSGYITCVPQVSAGMTGFNTWRNFKPCEASPSVQLFMSVCVCFSPELRMMAEGRFASLPRSLHAHHTLEGGSGRPTGPSPSSLGVPSSGSSSYSSRRLQASLASSMDLLSSRPGWVLAFLSNVHNNHPITVSFVLYPRFFFFPFYKFIE